MTDNYRDMGEKLPRTMVDWLIGAYSSEGDTPDELRAALAAAEKRLREADEIIDAFLDGDWLELAPPQGDAEMYGKCGYCLAEGVESKFKHDDDCPVTRARQWRKEAGR